MSIESDPNSHVSDDAGTQLTRDDPAQVVALAQLWADQFQHLTTLAVSGAGGLLILLH